MTREKNKYFVLRDVFHGKPMRTQSISKVHSKNIYIQYHNSIHVPLWAIFIIIDYESNKFLLVLILIRRK